MLMLCMLLLFSNPEGEKKEKKVYKYPKKIDKLVQHIGDEDIEPALAVFTKGGKPRNKILYQLEKGRIYQLRGEFQLSKEAFDLALEYITKREDRAVVSANKAANTARSAVVNDAMTGYPSYGYEKILIHHYQAINYLAMGDMDASYVEIRRGNFRQNEELEKHLLEIERAEEKARKKLEKAEKKANKKVDKAEAAEEAEIAAAQNQETQATESQPAKKGGFKLNKSLFGGGKKQQNQTNASTGASADASGDSETAKKSKGFKIPFAKKKKKKKPEKTNWAEVRKNLNSSYDEKYQGLDSIAGKLKSSFQNAATFYLSAVLYEASGKMDDAYIDYKKALEIQGGNPFVVNDTLRVAQKLQRTDELSRLKAEHPQGKANAAASDAMLIVFFEDGLAPKKQEDKIVLPIAGQLVSIATPYYDLKPVPKHALAVHNGRMLGKTEPICDIQALAAKALQERRMLMAARQITRMITKGTMTKVLERKAGVLGSLAGNAYGAASENADLRSWLTLPNNIQLAKMGVAAGDQTINLRQSALGINKNVSIAPKKGQIVLLQVTHFNNKTIVNTIHI